MTNEEKNTAAINRLADLVQDWIESTQPKPPPEPQTVPSSEKVIEMKYDAATDYHDDVYSAVLRNGRKIRLVPQGGEIKVQAISRDGRLFTLAAITDTGVRTFSVDQAVYRGLLQRP